MLICIETSNVDYPFVSVNMNIYAQFLNPLIFVSFEIRFFICLRKTNILEDKVFQFYIP